MIRVLHLRDTDRVCGPGKTIIETARAATPNEFHHVVGLLMLEREKRNAYLEAARARGVDVLPIRARSRLDPRIVREIVRVVKERQIDIIHSHDYKSDLLTWAVQRMHRMPVMTTVHGWIANTLKRRMYIRAAQAVHPGFDLVVAVSGETRALILRSGVPAHKVALIHNAIVMENYDPSTVNAGSVRAKFGIPAEARLVGCVGRLSPEKGQRDLLVAAAALRQSHPDVWYFFAGDGPDRGRLETQVADSGLADRVIFAGHLSDVRPVFRDIDLLALTSHTEGFPNVVLESLTMGTPVLATDVGGTREIVHDRQTGILLPAHQPDCIVAGMRELLDRTEWARSLALAGRDLVRKEFSFGQRVLKEEAICRQMLESWAP